METGCFGAKGNITDDEYNEVLTFFTNCKIGSFKYGRNFKPCSSCILGW
jgi:hypothetical protein